jgi:hypothetical protein
MLKSLNHHQIPDQDYNLRATASLGNETLHYVRSLENKIRELEEGRGINNSDAITQSKPEIIRALQVLQLERAANNGHENSSEATLVREMYNKVMKKLEDSSHDN